MRIRTADRVTNILVISVVLALLAGCAGKQVAQDEQLPVIPAKMPVSKYVRPDIKYMIDEYDPWEGFNRRMYNFNYHFDRFIFLPLVKGYEFITPDYVEDRISSFFKNLGELQNLTNNLFQLKGKSGAITFGRFLVNTSIGIAGLYDPATSFGLLRRNEDFGQTLGHYGVGAGPYLVLPVFGPSTVRDATGLAFDAAVYNAVTNEIINEFDMDTGDEDKLIYGLALLRAIDVRHRTSFRYYKSGSPFEYDLIRHFYLQIRDIEIGK